MRKLMMALPLLALATALSTANAQEERRAREECRSSSQAGMRECLQRKADDSDADLGRIEKQVREAIAKWDEDGKYVDSAKVRFDAANRQFTAYRDSQCAFNASLSGGATGNSREIRRLACVYEFNTRRTQQLKIALTDLPAR